jgi:RNA polymerase sigma-70 factor, ECF subfamily
MKKLRPRDQELLSACYDRSARIPEVARGWGRSSQSIHNSLRRIRRTLFECVSRSLAQEGGL